MVKVGPAITPPGQYTHCVDRNAYQDVPGVLDAGFPAMLEFLLCEYLLGGKLVCLGGDQCAIGIVVGLEAVGAGKKGLEALDNDFSFNVLLAPFEPNDFGAYGPPTPPDTNIIEPHRVRDDLVRNGPLGWLMVDSVNPTTLPPPIDQSGAPGWPSDKTQPRGKATWPVDGYGVLRKLLGPHKVEDVGIEGDNLHKLYDAPTKPDTWNPPPAGPETYVPLPVLHCECEGSRIYFVCQAMMPFLDLLQGKFPGGLPSPGEICHAVAKWLPWPFNKLVKAVCALAEDLVAIPIAIALAPAMAAAFATAWEASQAFDDLFVTGPVAKQIHIGDVVIVHGRWDWDAGHSGHTELHPVKSIQKLMTPSGSLPPEMRPPSDLSSSPPANVNYDPRQALPKDVASHIRDTHQRWCRLVSEAPPPPDPRHPDGLSPAQLDSMNPDQLGVWAAQRQPTNSWVVHPSIDGCTADNPQGGPR